MALGKNLKKKSLIPASSAKKSEKTVKESKKPVESVKNSLSKSKKEPIVEKVLVEESEELNKSNSLNTREPEFRLLNKQEFDRRVSLHAKFNKEVEALNDKKVHIIIFKIKDEEFAIEIDKIREVVPTPSISKMPQSPSYVPGIATIRGRAIVTIDLTKKLGLKNFSTEEDHFDYTMIVSTERFTVGILINEVPVNQIVDGNDIQSTAQDLSETTLDETYVKGMLKHEGRVIFLMDIDELIEGDRLRNRLGTGVNMGS